MQVNVSVIVICVLVACAYGAPQEPESEHDSKQDHAPILHQENIINPDGSYRYSYETGNGIKAEEEGFYKPDDTDKKILVVKGKYSFIGDDGQVYKVTYTADENGFQPSGAHLPTPPPIPNELNNK